MKRMPLRLFGFLTIGCLSLALCASAAGPGNLPMTATMDDGITSLQLFLDSDPPDPTLLAAAQADFAGIRAANPGNTTNRVFAAIASVLGIMTNPALQTAFANLGFSFGTSWGITGDLDPDSTQTLDQFFDVTNTNVLSALTAAYTDLDAIPTNWSGSFAILPSQFPNEVSEPVYVDIGDIQAMKASVEAFSAFSSLLHGYQMNLDYPKFYNQDLMQPAVTSRSIVVDGLTNDWAGVRPNLIGRSTDLASDARIARNGTNIYFLMTFQQNISASANLSVQVTLVVNGGNFHFSAWPFSNGQVGVNVPGATGAWSNNALELCVPYKYATPTDVYVDSVGYAMNSTEFRFSGNNIPVQDVLANQPEILSGIHDPASLAAARTKLLSAINLASQMDDVIGTRTDGLLHLVNVDPNDADAANTRLTLRTMALQIRDTLTGATNMVFQTDNHPGGVLQAVFLGALLGGGSNVAPRALLPPLDGPKREIRIVGAFPDATLGGVLPGMDATIFADIMDDGITSMSPATGFAQWAASQGITGDLGTQLGVDRDHDGVANGFKYALGANWSNGVPLMNIRMVSGQPVVEVPKQDASTTAFVSLLIEGSTDLLTGEWALPIESAPSTSEKPANCDWFRTSGTPVNNAFFHMRAIFSPPPTSPSSGGTDGSGGTAPPLPPPPPPPPPPFGYQNQVM